MQELGLRATSRAFAPDPIPAQTLSNLLWAAWGINRPADGKRTAPSARNWQEIDLMVVRADGTFLYDAASNRLLPVAAGALVHIGRIMQDFTADELTFGSAYTIGREMDEILGIDSPALSMAVRWMER
jgi:Nitroreductase family